MAQNDETQHRSYPIGRGYGHDYMRGGEVLGGYGYSDRPDYERRRGDGADVVEDGSDERGPRQEQH